MAVLEPHAFVCVTRKSAFLRLWLLGLIGAAVAASEPLPATLLIGANVPELAFRAVTFVNTALILAVLVGLGTVAAREVGLYSQFAPQVPVSAWRRHHALHWVQAAIVIGIAVAGAQLLFDLWFWRTVPHNQVLLLRHSGQLTASSPLSRLLFQALTEELMLRWGLMSGLMWVLALVLHRKPGRQGALIGWLAIIGMSVLCVLGQVPAILNVLATDSAAVLLVRSVAVSAFSGIAYGWLFWKHGLESALLGHVTALVGFAMLQGFVVA